MSDAVVLSLQDYFASMQENMGRFATGLSSAVKSYASTGIDLMNETEQSARELIKIYTEAYREAAAWSDNFAQTAADAGNPELAAIRQGMADHWNQIAEQLADEGLTARARINNMNNAVNNYLSEAVSPEWRGLTQIGAVFDAAGLVTAAINGDQDKFFEGCVGIVVSEAAAMLGAGSAIGLGILIGTTTTVWATALAAGAAAYGASVIAKEIYDAAKPGFYAAGMSFWEWWYGADIDDLTSVQFNSAAKYVQPVRRDPLTLDLDGDGLETVGTSAGILFDHDADGVKNVTRLGGRRTTASWCWTRTATASDRQRA